MAKNFAVNTANSFIDALLQLSLNVKVYAHSNIELAK